MWHIRQFVSCNTLTQSHGRRDIGMKEITISIADQGSAAFECNAYNNCYNHKYVVDLRNINLPMIFFWCVDDFQPRETTECNWLVDNWICCWNHGLTSNDCCSCSDHKHWPKQRSWPPSIHTHIAQCESESFCMEKKLAKEISALLQHHKHHSRRIRIPQKLTWDRFVECLRNMFWVFGQVCSLSIYQHPPHPTYTPNWYQWD